MPTIFKVSAPGAEPIYIFSKHGWVGLLSVAKGYKNKDNTVFTPITIWQFIKEWVKK